MEIISGRVKKPFSVILYGTPGIGKSTWAQNSPNPLFIGSEENDELHAKRLPKAESWSGFLDSLAFALSNHSAFDTLVVDTLDSVEKLLKEKILRDDPKSAGSMAQAHGGYGKAYERAETEMIGVKKLLQQLRDDKQKNIILLAHSNKTTADDTILGLRYDTYEMSIHKKVQAVFVDWVSCVLFGTYITHKVDDENSDKVFAIGRGERVVLTEKRPGFLAKNRYNLPYEMPLDFSVFYEYYQRFYENADEKKPDEIYRECIGLMSNIQDDELNKKIIKTLDEAFQANNITKMKQIKQRIEGRLNV